MARKNMRTGISMFIVLLAMLGVSFVWAALYLIAVK
jgi:hypothetical protein